MNSVRYQVTVGRDAPVFRGHFPDYPILPGVMLLSFAREALAPVYGEQRRIRRILRQRFLRPVTPGSTVLVECRVGDADTDGYRVSCRWSLPDGSLLSRGEFIYR